ncbi:MAG: MBOAT family protein [Planctomycetes bacterium]|nr:MBOAT family protein [Planctomycetota bacterium]
MLFTSPVFLLFFALVFAVCRLGPPWALRKAFLLAASLAFYAAWNPPFVLLLLGSVVLDYCVGLALDKTQGNRARKALLAISLCGNLGVLAAFKYANFLSENFIAAAGAAGWDISLMPWNVVLPVGISFYTFQTLSYSIDLYRRKIPVERSLLDFALFVTFFPQLVAGPIVRASEFLPQLKQPRQATASQICGAFCLFALGLFKKSFLADRLLAPMADSFLGAGAAPSTIQAWTGLYAFAGQIYCDFSGYSDMAIALALAMGFVLPENFRAPYGAVGFSDFWRRWHISLSTWLRDYLYIPLGGNRKGRIRTRINLLLTMLLGGLWHGAAWTFVAWGAWHGLLLGVERVLRSWLPATPGRWLRVAGALVTLHAVCLGWVLFRAESLGSAWTILQALAGFGRDTPVQSRWEIGLAWMAAWGIFAVHMAWPQRRPEDWARRLGWAGTGAAVAAMLFLVITKGLRGGAFIYFQF